MSLDPMVAKTRSPYGYVGGNPLNGTDPTGASKKLPNGWCIKNPLDRKDHSCDTGANEFRDWESPDAGADYKNTSYGVGPLSFNVTITKDDQAYFGPGFGASAPLVNYSQANGYIMSSIGQRACVSDGDVNKFASGGGVNISMYGVVGGGITASSIDGQQLEYATEYGVGTPQVQAQVTYMFGP